MLRAFLCTFVIFIKVDCSSLSEDVQTEQPLSEEQILAEHAAHLKALRADSMIKYKNKCAEPELDRRIKKGESVTDLFRETDCGAPTWVTVKLVTKMLELIETRHLKKKLDKDGLDPFMRLFCHRDCKGELDSLIEVFLNEKHFTVNHRLPCGITPAHFAAGFGRRSALLRLLWSDVDVNAANDVGATPLWFAVNVERPDPRVLCILLNAGADPYFGGKPSWPDQNEGTEDPKNVGSAFRLAQAMQHDEYTMNFLCNHTPHALRDAEHIPYQPCIAYFYPQELIDEHRWYSRPQPPSECDIDWSYQ